MALTTKLLKEAVGLDPEEWKSHYFLAIAYEKTAGEPRKVLDHALRAERLCPQDLSAHARISELLRKTRAALDPQILWSTRPEIGERIDA